MYMICWCCMDVYELLGVSADSDSLVISARCRELREGLLCSDDLDSDAMLRYLSSTAVMLLEPSSRASYDLWLQAMRHGHPMTCKMAGEQIKWFNAHNRHLGISFDTNMLKMLPVTDDLVEKPRVPQKHTNSHKHCRYCNKSLGDKHHILQCQCTARIGHMDCGEGFYNEFKGKCPVCKQTLLKRTDISKYLWWNAKQRYKI